MNISVIFEKYFTRPFSRLADNPVLNAIRNSFVLMLPLVITGSAAVLINNFPLPWYQGFMLGIFGEQWHNIGNFILFGTFSVMSLIMSISVSYNMAVQYNTKHTLYKINPLICSIVGFASLLTVMHPKTSAGVIFQWTGVSGLFVSIIVAVAASLLFINLSRIKLFRIQFFAEEADFAMPHAISALFPALITILFLAVIRGLFDLLDVPDIFEFTSAIMQLPFAGGHDSLSTAILYICILQLLWFTGLHGANILDPVTQDIYVTAMENNRAAFLAGEPLTHVITKPFLDVFVFMGGAGATICLLLAMFLFSRRTSTRRLGQISMVPALFNINEILIFGIPIVFNPLFLIPFLLCPVIIAISSYLFTITGLLPYTYTNVDWTTPPLINAYIATGSLNGTLVQLCNLFLGMTVYLPFVLVYEKNKENRFQKVYTELVQVATNGENDFSTQLLLSRTDDVGTVARALANEMGLALERKEFYLEYQPQVDVNTSRVFGVEALLRWKHPHYGNIPPSVIIPVAEDSGLINEIGLWVIREASASLAQWKAQGIKDIHISANLSVMQLRDPMLAAKIKAILTEYDIAPGELELEVTESIALTANKLLNNTLLQIHNMGIKIAVDDFGMGHSSLVYLRQFPVDVLKIDSSLSKDVLEDPHIPEIIITIVDLCRNLDIDLIVEFVETDEQLEALMKLGTRRFQGYLFSKPLSPQECFHFVKNSLFQPAL